MSRLYSCNTFAVSTTTALDLYEVLAGTGFPIRIHGWHLYQTTDLGDAAEEVLQVECLRGIGTVTSGSGGSTSTPQPLVDADTASAATVETNNTTRMVVGTGNIENLEQYGWNIRIPWTHFYTPELRPQIKPGDRWVLGIRVAPADSITFGSTLWLEET